MREFLGRIFLKEEFTYKFYITAISQTSFRFVSGNSIEGNNNVKIVWMFIQLLDKLFAINSHSQEYGSVKQKSN